MPDEGLPKGKITTRSGTHDRTHTHTHTHIHTHTHPCRKTLIGVRTYLLTFGTPERVLKASAAYVHRSESSKPQPPQSYCGLRGGGGKAARRL